MSRENNLLIIGAGQYGYVVKETVEAIDGYDRIEFIDDDSSIAIGTINQLYKFTNDYANVFVAIGNNKIRLNIINQLKKFGYRQVTLIHPKAYVSPSAKLGEGCIVEANAVVHANVKIGMACLISAGAVVNHNAVIEDACHVDCNATVAARSIVKMTTKVNSGQVYKGETNYV